MYVLKINGQEYQFEKMQSLKELASSSRFICAKVNNRLRELSYVINHDAKVQFLDIKDQNAMRVYETTLRYVILKALYNLYPDKSFRYINSVSRSYLLLSTDTDECLDQSLLIKLDKEVQRLIHTDLPIKRIRVSVAEAKAIFLKQKMYDKVEMLKYRKTKFVNLYQCENYYNYLYGYMMCNTQDISNYRLLLHNPGILVSYPRADLEGEIPEYAPNHIYDKLVTKAIDKVELLNIDSVNSLNTFIGKNSGNTLINMAETIHNNELTHLADTIEMSIRNIKLICVAGPSSSGKTTFTKRLQVELLARGLKPVMISIDNYYKAMADIPKGDDGDYDFETIRAFDIKRFNQDLKALLAGDKVRLRERDMYTKEVIDFGETVQLAANSPIIIEGIHALNDLLTSSIANKYKFKIYISPVLALNIDDHSPINLTDARMLRRIVRDKKFRNLPAERTLELWDDVRAGEFKWIYPYSINVDYVFNSNLLYELSVMKKYAIDSLNDIKVESANYIEANRLLKFLRYIDEIDDAGVPANSLLREFIGGSSY